MRIPFAVGSYQSRSMPLSSQRLVNAYVQKSPDENKSQAPVFRAPGIKAFTEANGAVRGAIVAGDNVIVVAGQIAYQMDSSGNLAALGSIPGTGPVSLATSGSKTVAVINDGRGYVITTSVAQITDADYVPSSAVVWTDSLFVFLGQDRIFHSAINDPTTFDALAYDQAVGSPDRTIALLAEKRDLIHFGESSVEIWYNKGTTPYAFARAPDGFVEIGCAAARSPAKLDNTVFWLADDRTVRALRGATPQRISTETIEQAIAGYSMVSDAFGMAYAYDGRFVYALSFPTAGHTWEYDVAAGSWSERQSYGRGDWRVEGVLRAWGKLLVWSGNLIGELDFATYTEWGEILRLQMTSAPIVAGPSQVFHNRLEVQCEAGVGLVTGQGSNPQLMMRYSDDSFNWSPEFWRTLGAQGKYQQRVVWTRLGRSRGRVYELSYSDPTPFVFYGAYLNEDEALVA